MERVRKIAVVVLSVLSLAAGLAKVMQSPQEVSFFAAAGLGLGPLLALGALQVSGGVLALIARTRAPGLFLVTLGFGVSVLIIALTGNMGFAALSALPALASLWLLLHQRRAVRGA